MATLGLKVEKKVCLVGCLSLVCWPYFFPYLPKGIFPISFKPMVAIAKFIGEMQKTSGFMKSGLDTMPRFLLDDLLSKKIGQL